MEELRSTEILDKEIHEDARKKAERILANADAECKKIMEGVASRIAAARKEKEAAYAAKLAGIQKDSEAAIPLEQERFLVSFEGSSVIAAVNRYLESLSLDKQFKLIEKLLVRYQCVLDGKSLTAVAIGFTPAEVMPILSRKFGSDAVTDCRQVPFESLDLSEPAGLTVHKGIVLETQDGAVRCRATFGELVAEILDDHSYELAETLFCGGLPQ